LIMALEINPFLMFASGAEQAMDFYMSLFPGSRVESIDRYEASGPGVEGSVKLATLNLLGRKLEFFDSRYGTPSPSPRRSPSWWCAKASRKWTSCSPPCRKAAKP